MAVFGYDEAHRERWTISPAEASSRSPHAPERHAFRHLVGLSEEILKAESRPVSVPWDDDNLASVDVLIVAEPDGADRSPGHGPPPITDLEVEALRGFVKSGGGLFVIAGAGAVAVAALIAALFDIKVSEQEIRTLRDGSDYLLTATVACDDVERHGTTSGVRRIFCQRGVSLECHGESSSVIRTPMGETVFAVTSYGVGRVAVIGSGEIFSSPHIGQGDNALLYINILSWLAKDEHDSGNSSGWGSRVGQLLRDRHFSLQADRPISGPSSGPAVPSLDVSEFSRPLLRLCEAGLDPYENVEAFLLSASLAFHDLPRRVRQAVLDFRSASNDFGALLITGLPADRHVPPTPADPASSPLRKTYFSEFWLSVFSGGLGDQIGYAQESGGALFQNVLPTEANASSLSSQSSEAPLDFHTEIAFHPAMPDFLLLSCLRPAPEEDVRTLVAGSRRMVRSVPPEYRQALFRDAFRTGIDYSFGSPDRQAGNGPLVSVLQGDPFDPLMRLDPDLMVGVDERSRTALAEIRAAGDACQAGIVLKASDLLLIDNRRAVHGRSRFTASYDGRDRWLQRSYVVRDLTRFSGERTCGGRVIDTAFVV